MLSTKIIKLELQNVWTISRNSSRFKENVFVKLEKDGITAFGEAAPNIRYGESARLTQQMIERTAEAFCAADLTNCAQVKEEIIDPSIINQNCARAALDIAMIDYAAKRLNLPLYQMLERDPADTPVTSFSIGIDTPDEIKRKVLQAADFPVLKIKLGTDHDEAIISAVRSVTDKPIRVDANEGWTDKETAITKIDWLSRHIGVEFIEQPMPAHMLRETAWVRRRVDIPFIADEAVKTAADIPALSQVYDGINIKLMKAGGIQEALGMIHVARAVGLKIMLGCMIESSLAITAAAHISPLVDWADLDGNLLITNDPFSGVKVKNGKLLLNNLPGLGTTGNW